MTQKKTFLSPPDDQVFDPRYGMPVSRHGQDTGALERDCEMVAVSDPHGENALVTVRRVRGGLVRLRQHNTIDDDMFVAGRHFQHHFAIAGYCNYTTVNLQGYGGGGVGAAWGAMQQIEATAQSRGIVGDYLRVLGYPNMQVSKAAWWIIGHETGLDEMARKKELHGLNGCGVKQYWSAMTVAALQLMSLHYDCKYSGKAVKAKLRGQRNYDDSSYVVREGTVPQP